MSIIIATIIGFFVLMAVMSFFGIVLLFCIAQCCVDRKRDL